MRLSRRGRRHPSGALAVAHTADGELVYGTRDTLELPGRSLRWEQVLTAEWDRDTELLRVVLVEPEEIELALVEPTDFLQLVRERVTASVVLSRRVPVAEQGFMLMVRRPPAGGELAMVVEYDRGLDPDAPKVVEALRAAQAQVRSELGW
ncbi:MAG: hypothetical protein QM655_03540 [Nocardioidaceae bacterium]